MRSIQLFSLIWFLVATRAVAQQTLGSSGNGMGTGAMDRPGGISHVTRPRPTAGAAMAASGFFAAGGVRVTAPVTPDSRASGSASTGISLAGAARTPGGTVAASGSAADPRVLATLQRLAAAGNPDAQRALSAWSRGGR